LVGLADSYAWLVLEVSGLEVPFPCSAQKGSARVHGSHGVFSPTTRSNPMDPVLPGVPRPGTFRPQGLITLSTASSPPGLAPGPSTRAAPMGFALQGLAPPGRRYPSQGLPSHVVSPLPLARTRSRLQRSSPTGKGNESRRPKTTTAAPCPPGCCAPSGFSPPSPWDRLPGPSPSCPFDRKCSLRFHSRAGLQGFDSDESGLPLSRLPALLGFRTFPCSRASLGRLIPGIWLHLGPKASSGRRQTRP